MSKRFEQVEYDFYRVRVEKLELKKSKKGHEMVTVWMRIQEGHYKNRFLFYNQVIHQSWGIEKIIKFLKRLKTGINIKFENHEQFCELLKKIEKEMNEHKEDSDYIYGIDYFEGKNGFPQFEIFE